MTKEKQKGKTPGAEKSEKPKTAAEKKIVNFEDIDSSAMVNIVKAERAFKAVFGGAKGGSAELVLVQKLAGEYPDKEKLVTEVYKGLGGLLDVAKAKKNRANEAKDRARKASK